MLEFVFFCCRIGDAIKKIGGLIGSLIPNYGDIVSIPIDYVGDRIQEKEHEKYQKRMSVIASVGDVQELNDVARQVAFDLACRYEKQLLALTPGPKKCCSWCCSSPRCCSTDPKVKEPNKALGDHPAWRVAQFGVDCLIARIINKESDELKLEEGMEADHLVKVLVELICQTKPNLVANLRRTLKLEANNLLLYDREDASKKDVPGKWHLFDFYYKPGIRWPGDQNDDVLGETLSWMAPEAHGYRLGTEEEHQALEKADKKKSEKKSCSYCC